MLKTGTINTVIAIAVPLAVMVMMGSLTTARADQLDKAACAALTSKIADFEKRGVVANKAKGPAWAKLNLAASDLDAIKQLIETEATVKFRCPQAKEPKTRTAGTARRAQRGATARTGQRAASKVMPSSARGKPGTKRKVVDRRRRQSRQPTSYFNPFQ